MGINKEVLQSIIPDRQRLIFERIEPQYLSDTLGRLHGNAEALIFAQSTKEVSAVLKYAYQDRIPITPRGAGTNLVGSTVPVDGGIILDLSLMNKVLELSRDTLTATVEPGVILRDFQSLVEKIGLFYPPDPGEKSASIGGNISTNAGGMRAVKYGVTRNYVRGLEAVLPDGTVLNVGGKNVKDASGLSLKDLLIGSEGTIAVITKCVLKLIPKPEVSISVLVPYRDLAAGIESVLGFLQADVNPTAVEFMERKVVQLGENFLNIKYPDPNAGSYILLTFDGHSSEVQANVERARKIAFKNGALDYLMLSEPCMSSDIWKVRGALVKAVEAVSEQEPVDIVVPINKTTDFIRFVNHIESISGMRMISFGHAGDGNIHLCAVRGNRSKEAWHNELRINLEKIYDKAYELGGVVSGEHGIGLSKRHYFLRETPKQNLRVMNQIKEAIDPLHILNDKKSYIIGGIK